MATLASLSTPLFSYRRSLTQRHFVLFKKDWACCRGPRRCRKRLLLPAKCSSPGPIQDEETEANTTPSVSSSSPSPSSSSPSDLTYKLCAGLGGIGFLETAYLTYLKLTGSDAFCPIGGGSCGDILNSEYAVVFGVPLPLIGMVAYGLVATLGLQLPRKTLSFGLGEADGRLILLGSTTSMAASSAYFLYILSTKFTGTSCSYCLLSAFLSFSLFFITVREFGLQEIQKAVAFQFVVASLVVVALNSSYSTSQILPSSNQSEINLPYFTSEITSPSSPFAISLAKHLKSIGAKMYGAFWCSHCVEQKQMFGREAAKLLNYVECFPKGYKNGTKMEKECAGVGIEGFPTWVINGKVLSGEKDFSELAEESGFTFDKLSEREPTEVVQ